MALRLKAPIFTHDDLLGDTSVDTVEPSQPEMGVDDVERLKEAERLKEYLENLDPEDFGKFTP